MSLPRCVLSGHYWGVFKFTCSLMLWRRVQRVRGLDWRTEGKPWGIILPTRFLTFVWLYSHTCTHIHVHTLIAALLLTIFSQKWRFYEDDGEWFIAFHSCAFTFSVRGGLGRAMLRCFPGQQRDCYCCRSITPLLSALWTADTSHSSISHLSCSSDWSLSTHKEVLCSCLLFCFMRFCVLRSVQVWVDDFECDF